MSTRNDIHSGKYYSFMDGFRALSILWVILHHIFIFFNPVPLASPRFIPVLLMAKLGLLGVDMFFVISGFLITGLLINDLHGTVRMKRFYLRRILKIIPTYISAILGGVLMLILIKSYPFYCYGIKEFTDEAVRLYRIKANLHADFSLLPNYIFFFQNYHPRQLFTLAHTWSIAVEEHFYVVYPLILWGVSRLTKDLSRRIKYLTIILIMLIITANVYRYICLFHLSSAPYQTTLFRMDALIFGCLLRILEPQISSLSLQKTKFLAIVALVMGMLTYYSIFVFSYCHYAIGLKSKYVTLYLYVAYYLAPGFLILSALMGFRPLLKLTSHKLLILIGKASYGIYLWHYIIIFPFVLLQNIIPTVLAILLYFLASLVAGHLSTITIERYFLNIRNKVIP